MSRHSLSFIVNSESPDAPLGVIGAINSISTQFASATAWDSRREETKVHIEKLLLTDDQLSRIQDIYTQNQEIRRVYCDATSGLKFLSEHGLDPEAREKLESKWSVTWSMSWPVSDGHDRVFRVLFQCVCGFDTKARQALHRRQTRASHIPPSTNSLPLDRRAPFDFYGCLAHADITYLESTGEVRRVLGVFDHVLECKKALLTRLPPVPLHVHVVEVALSQLADGASITAVQLKNTDMIEQRAYRDMDIHNTSSSNHRFQIHDSDFSALYRTHNRRNGVDISVAPEQNINNWLDPKHPHFKPALSQAIFMYCARTRAGERLKVCISTTEMDNAAWEYGHENQIILDGTFGVCSSRLLLFIVMTVDDKNRGVPVALLLFSAPTGNRATHSGYNTVILSELLQSWKTHLEMRGTSKFNPYVAITDTDTKERAALIQVWPGLCLLLCRFHLRQCWTNKRKSLCKITKDGENGAPSFWKDHVSGRLKALEDALLETTTHNDALQLVAIERQALSSLLNSPASSKLGTAGLTFLQYLETTWLDISLWSSWSCFGRERAATRLKKLIECVIPTTNHLESFNGVLKRKYIPQWQRSGNRLRFDILIHHLVLIILPQIFARRRMTLEYGAWADERFRAAAGGVLLHSQKSETQGDRSHGLQHTTQLVPLAWFEDDTARDAKANALLHAGRLMSIPPARPYEIWATCAATSANTKDPSHLRYWITAHPSGSATCTCPDWCTRGGACKHLRALKFIITHWITTGAISNRFPFYFPKTREEATKINHRITVWYGPHFPDYVTTYLSQHPGPPAGPTATAPPNLTSNIGFAAQKPPLDPPSASDSAPPQPAQILEYQSQFQKCAGDDAGLDDDENPDMTCESDTDSELPSSVLTENQRAIKLQRQQRLQHSFANVLPLLYGISTLLDDGITLDDIPDSISDVKEFRSIISTLNMQISTPVKSSNLSPLPSTPRPHALTRATTSSSKHLLPPSPELKQKRKKSHGTL